MADIIVIQAPVSVSFDCDNCGEEISIDYDDFVKEYGECCDWGYGDTVKCPHCGHENLIDNWEFD